MGAQIKTQCPLQRIEALQIYCQKTKSEGCSEEAVVILDRILRELDDVLLELDVLVASELWV